MSSPKYIKVNPAKTEIVSAPKSKPVYYCKIITAILVVVACVYFVYAILFHFTTAGNNWVLPYSLQARDYLLGRSYEVITPDQYTNPQTQMCCDNFKSQQLASAFARETSINCSNNCNHARCTNSCPCAVSDIDFVQQYPNTTIADITKPYLTLSDIMVTCDGGLYRVTQGSAQTVS